MQNADRREMRVSARRKRAFGEGAGGARGARGACLRRGMRSARRMRAFGESLFRKKLRKNS